MSTWASRCVRRIAALLGAAFILMASVARTRSAHGADATRPPNIIIFFTDDQGYGDVGCYGARQFDTPQMDRLAREGTRFTSFYVSQPVCSASRASLLTGCYANRVGLEGALNPTSKVGINPDERLLSEMLRERGYATALFGKWHLGHHTMFHPLNHGFDHFFGLPYPNDCSNEFHPIVRTFPPLPLIDGHKTIAEDPDQSQFTKQFTSRSLQFIEANRERPFFLFLAHVMPHVPIHASAKFRGKSRGGLYGDVIEELDDSLGQILQSLEQHGIDDDTLLLFTSDNGPFLSYGSHAGSSGPLRGGKLTTFEGGVRMPCLVRWPGHVPAGRVSDEIVTAMDLVPTFAKLCGAKLSDRTLDGKDVWPVLAGEPDAKSPHHAFLYYAGSELHAVRSGDWKLHFPHEYLEVAGEPGRDGKPANFANLKPEDLTKSGLEGIATRHGYRIEQLPLSLFHLSEDLGERKNVAAEHPDVVRRLQAIASRARVELGDSLTDARGSGLRPAGRLPDSDTP